MEQRRLGATGPTVGMLGLGCMGMTGVYGPADAAECVATIHAALDAGDRALISVKFGAMRDPAGASTGYDARPAAVKNFAAYRYAPSQLVHLDSER